MGPRRSCGTGGCSRCKDRYAWQDYRSWPVVSDGEQMKLTHVEGPPALVVEVLYTRSEQHDRMRKHLLYAEHGVPEYWMVSPAAQTLEILALKDGTYSVADSRAE